LATANAVDGHFTVSVVRTAVQIAADAQAGVRYSLGNVAGNIDITYTRIAITEIPPTSTLIYDMQTDLNLSNLRNNVSIPFLRGVGVSNTAFAVNMSSNPRTVTVTNRGGTSQGIRVIAADIDAIARPDHLYKLEFSGVFPNDSTATARIRLETPTGDVLATTNAVNGHFTLSATLTAEQIAADALAGRHYSLGNVSGNIDIVYTAITISELPVPSIGTVVYNMQTDSNLPDLRNNTNIPFMRCVAGSGMNTSVNMNTSPRTVTISGRSGTSQGIQLIAADLNAVTRPNHLYKVEFSGRFPGNPTATARVRVENPSGETLATSNAIDEHFSVSFVLTAEQIATDAQAGRRYSLGNESGNINIVYTGITITEIPVIRIFDSFMRFDEPVVAASAIDISTTGANQAIVVNSYLLSESHIWLNAGSLYGGAATHAVVASRNGDISLTANSINFHGIIYAPNGRVTINGSGIINGRIFAQEIVIVSDTLTIIAGEGNISHLGFVPPCNGSEPYETTPPTTTSTEPVTTPPTTDATMPSTTLPTTAPTHTVTSPTTPASTDCLEPGFTDVEYEYDDLGRLTRVVFDDENYIVYEYDANGNITRVTRVVDGATQE
jgi:YD repeat-containing protein